MPASLRHTVVWLRTCRVRDVASMCAGVASIRLCEGPPSRLTRRGWSARMRRGCATQMQRGSASPDPGCHWFFPAVAGWTCNFGCPPWVVYKIASRTRSTCFARERLPLRCGFLYPPFLARAREIPLASPLYELLCPTDGEVTFARPCANPIHRKFSKPLQEATKHMLWVGPS